MAALIPKRVSDRTALSFLFLLGGRNFMKKLDFKINSRLFVRLFVSYMACILVPLAVFVTIIIIYAQTNIHQNAVKTYSTIQEANIQNFEDTIREIYNTAFRLSTESAVKNLNSNTYQDKIERNFEIKDVMSSLRISGSRIFQTNSADIAVYFDKNSVVVTPDGKYSYENYMKDKEILKYLDVLVDGQYVDELHDFTLKWRGSSNQRVIDIPKTLKAGEVVLFEEAYK